MPRRHGNENPASPPEPTPRRTREDIDLFDQEAGPTLAAALAASVSAESLNCKVLVLNRLYVAVRVVSARRAFCLLMRDIAEVIDVQPAAGTSEPASAVDVGDQYINYDFATWAGLAALRPRFESYPLPRSTLPKWLVWLVGPLADKSTTRKFVSRNIGYPWKADNSKSVRELQMVYRPTAETMQDMFQQMIDTGQFARA